MILDDGIALLPDQPGIYCIFNRLRSRRGVGLASKSIRRRALEHRHSFKSPKTCASGLARDLQVDGAQAFMFIALEVCLNDGLRNHRAQLRARELWWAEQLLALDEATGYNLEAGGRRSLASRFRDTERKLMRSRSGRYMLLPTTDPNAPINAALLASWAHCNPPAAPR